MKTKRVRIEVYGVSGYGKNTTEAKIDAGKAITASMKGDYTPVIIARPGIQDFMFVYREPILGWAYMVSTGCVISSNSTKEKTVADASYHLEQNAWNRESDDTFPLLDRFPEKKEQLQSWARWQRDFYRLVCSGLTEQQAYAQAKG